MTDLNQERSYVILGSGQLGLAIMDSLAAADENILLVNRSGSIAEVLPNGVSVRQADLTEPDSVESVVQGAEVAFMCAAPPYTDWPGKFPQLINSVVEGVSRTGAKLVFGDNLYMYGPSSGKPLHENLPYAAIGSKGKTRAQVANTLLDAHKSGKLQVTIGRGSDFFGPRVTGSALGSRVFGAALEGKTVDVLGDIDLPHTYTYIRDFADSLITLATHEQAYGEAWHVPNAPTMTTQQWLDIIAKQVGQPLKIRSTGAFMVRILGLFNPAIRESREMMYEFSEPFVVDDTKFRNAFGGTPTDPTVAIQETLDWYRRQET